MTVAVAALAFVAALVGVRLVLDWLTRRAYLDVPNDRSSHTVPTPRGAGLAVTPVVAACLLVVTGVLPDSPELPSLVVPVLALILFALSWADDRRSLPAGLRLGVQAAVIAAALMLWPADGLVFQGILPPSVDRMAAGLMWLWFVNLYNFMDGIDGITGVETASIGLGMATLSLLGAASAFFGTAGGVLAGAAAGFLVWNWHPARIFMGDSGSVPLGFMIGGLLLFMAGEGLWAAALILPAYYLADATTTLLRRVLRGENPARAHREHLYQKAIHLGGLTHSSVSARIAVANALLVGCAVISVYRPVAALVVAAVIVGILFLVLSRR